MKNEIINIGAIPGKVELDRSLREGKIPVKYCYLNEGANKWHTLRQNNNYVLGLKENSALKRGLVKTKEILGKNKPNLVHLGVGDGIEIPYFTDILDISGKARYAGVDISKTMIQNSLKFQKRTLSQTNPLWYLSDVELKGSLEMICNDVKRKGSKRNILSATNEGSLLSNKEIFSLIQESLDPGDYFFATLEGDNPSKRKEILENYCLSQTQDLLSVGIKKAGYNPKEGEFLTEFNESESRVEVFFVPKNESPILCLASYKPKKEELEKTLVENKLNPLYFELYDDIGTFAVFSQKGE